MLRKCGSLKPVITGVALAVVAATGSVTVASKVAHAGSGGAFVGGLIGGHVLTTMANQSERRTRAAEYQAYSQPRQAAPAPAPAPAQAAPPTVEERLDTLDKLAANGMITKEEYDRRRQAIIDGI